MSKLGWGIRTVIFIVFVMDAVMPLISPGAVRGQMIETGFPPAMGVVISGSALLGAILYGIPRTAVLGAIVLTGFLGGAICTHVRLGQFGSVPQIISLVLGVLVWAGLYLTDPRVRALIPLSKSGA